ncbi:hypothetical protein DFH29DRAFT_880371 [Suillus ampliporus]|nr:hypothetical protein DFH29DRAFT_880371 [Suillus ampliporus]
MSKLPEEVMDIALQVTREVVDLVTLLYKWILMLMYGEPVSSFRLDLHLLYISHISYPTTASTTPPTPSIPSAPMNILSLQSDLLLGDVHPKCRFCGVTQTTLPPCVFLKSHFFVGNTIEVLPAEEKEI